ncbi:MAG: hypothetical protein ONB24_13605 [candidate division KSB1 bacterium]|nr:hypothetical protein [candidate division KSB1 bacterium]
MRHGRGGDAGRKIKRPPAGLAEADGAGVRACVSFRLSAGIEAAETEIGRGL